MERVFNRTPWELHSQPLRGIKHFQDFKKKPEIGDFENVSTVSYTNKMERYIQLDPLGAAFAASLREKKHLQAFNGKKPSVNLKPPVPFPTLIKWKQYSIGPPGAAFAASLRGDKTSFQNGKKPSVNWNPPVPLPPPIKWKGYQVDLLGASFEASLRGINNLIVEASKSDDYSLICDW